MFTTYIKGLNDMVFSTSENPEEQLPSPGVLGRIGSWFSPWRGRSAKSPTENGTPTGDPVLKPEGEQESGGSVRPEAGERLCDQKEKGSEPNPLGLSRDIFFCEEADAAQSARRDRCVGSSSEPAEGGPKEEELLDRKKRDGRRGQGEEGSNGNSVTGNPEKNASHLTHPSSAAEQGVAGSCDQDLTQPLAHKQEQTQTGRRFHVYVEEISVTQCGQNTCPEQEVVRTKVKENLQVLPKSKSSPRSDSSADKSQNVRAAVGSESRDTAPAGVKPRKDCQSEPEPEKTGGMGRKNVARRKSRRNSQGDGGSSHQEKVAANGQPAEGDHTSDNSQTLKGEAAVSSSHEPTPTCPASPGGGETDTSCPETAKHSDNLQDAAPSLARAVDGGADMEDDGGLYRVERKTETPESKRRSMKVSQSEVKLFKKCVPLKAEQSPAGGELGLQTPGEKSTNGAEERASDLRVRVLKTAGEQPKPAPGRIADKISLFERQGAGGREKTPQTPRSADVSPARKVAGRLKADAVSELRSRSAERYGAARSGSASPNREIPKTIKERMKNFTQESRTDRKAAPRPTSVTTGMAPKSTGDEVGAASTSPELDGQGERDRKEQTETAAVPEITLKPDGRDTKEKHIDPETQTAKAAAAAFTPREERHAAAKGTGESRGPSRTGSRSKRRKSREPVSPKSPRSPSSPNSFTSKDEGADVEQQVDLTLSLPSDAGGGTTADKLSETEPLEVDGELGSSDGRKQPVDSSSGHKRVKAPGPPAAARGETKTATDDVPDVLPQKEENTSVSVREEVRHDTQDDRGTPVSCRASSDPPETPPPAEHPGSAAEAPRQSDSQREATANAEQPGNETTDTSKIPSQTENNDSWGDQQRGKEHTQHVRDVSESSEDVNGAPALPTTLSEKAVGGAGGHVGSQVQTSANTEQTAPPQTVPDPSVPTSVDSKLAPSEERFSGNRTEPSPGSARFQESNRSAGAVSSQRPLGAAASTSTPEKILRSDEKTPDWPATELSPAAVADTSPHTHLQAANNQSSSSSSSSSPKANHLSPDSFKNLSLPRRRSRDDSEIRQDAPSSWLDVDVPKQKLKFSGPKLTSCSSESNLLDTSGEIDDDDFIEKINNLCAPFSLPPRKHNHLRPPQPPFAMPAIREVRLEKTFDPEEFQFGLRKKNHFTLDTTPGFLGKLQHTDTKSGLKPARASFTERSVLLGNRDARVKDRPAGADEENVKEERDDLIKVKSRLEGSCVLSSLTSSSFRGKRNGPQAQADGVSPGDVSPGEPPLPSPPPAPTSPGKDAEAVEHVVSESCPPLPSFDDVKLPDYLEKYLPRQPAKPGQSAQETINTEVKKPSPVPVVDADLTVRPGGRPTDAVPPFSPGVPPYPTALPELTPPLAQPQITSSFNERCAKGFHKRPGKMVLFEKAQFRGRAYDIYRDVADAAHLQLSPLVSVKVIRGCWILYEKPDFQGRSIALEEGGIELTNVWAETEQEAEPRDSRPMLIGSIRLAVSDYSVPHIHLFTEAEGRGRGTPYHDDTIETGSFGLPVSTASIQVHSGVWLVFSDPGFQGMLAVLETGVYPFPETWGFPSPFVGSLRPLKMGGFKVENPSEVKAVVYQQPGFEGSCLGVDSDVCSFCESEGDVAADKENSEAKKLKSVGSLKIIGGLWVGYSQPEFEGQQHILEEGEYLDCSDWGGSEPLLSLRPILSDFMSPHLRMFSETDLSERGVNIDLTVPVVNMDDTGYGTKTQSADVGGGVWVVFEEPGFCGETYVLEKGLYACPEDWGALTHRIASAMPVVLDDFENVAKFKVQLFSDPAFQGSVLVLENSVASLPQGFSVASCKVLAGSWLAFEGQDLSGRMYVLEEGRYPDLRVMGCVDATSSVLSLQPAGFEFSLPSITLFERLDLRGKRVVLTEGSVNLQLAAGGGRVQSLFVEGGIWILYEGINYRGAQMLLRPGEVPDWHMLSNWKRIGSLRPLLQRQVHFRLRNRQTGLLMSVTGDLDDVKLLRIQETEESDGLEQIWFYHSGRLHCKMLDGCCLCPSGSVTIAGCRAGFTPEQDTHVHLWSITPEGFVRYTPTTDLVLEVKGGHHYDKNQVILNTLDPNKPHQKWNVEII